MKPRTYEVWHIKPEVVEEIAAHRGHVTVQFPHDYERVARVTARDLEQVFEKTTSYDVPWSRKAGVECLKETRSTMVNDIVISPDHELYQVTSDRFRLIAGPAQELARAKGGEQGPDVPARAREHEPDLVR
jgi:hypothetical protein